MNVQDAIEGRRSVRKFTGEAVDEATVNAILDAGRWAPSGRNNQPWKFRVLRGEDKDSIAGYTKYANIVKGAAVCIAVFYDEKAGYDRTKDVQAVGACIQNMLLSIHGMGLGGVWLGQILGRREEAEKELGVGCELMAVVAIGRPAETGGDPHRKGLDELMV